MTANVSREMETIVNLFDSFIWRSFVNHSSGVPPSCLPNVAFQPRRLILAPAAVGCKPG
jgi:hypothetical protein